MANDNKKIRIKAENSDSRWIGGIDGKIETIQNQEDTYFNLFLCPSAQPSWLEPPLPNNLDRCEGSHRSCPEGPDSMGHAIISISEHKGVEMKTDGDNYLALDQKGNIRFGSAGQSNKEQIESGQIEFRSKKIKIFQRYRNDDLLKYQPDTGKPYCFTLGEKPLADTVICVARFVDPNTQYPMERLLDEELHFQINYEKKTITFTDESLKAAEKFKVEFCLSPVLTIAVSDDNISLKFENNDLSSEIVYQGNDLHLTPGKNGKVVIKGDVSVEGNIEYTGTCAPVQPKPK